MFMDQLDIVDASCRLDEKDTLQEILDQALACRDCLSEIVDSSLSFFDKDVSTISGKLTIALKVLDLAPLKCSKILCWIITYLVCLCRL